MAKKKRKRKYSPSVGSDVESEMRRYKRGTARSGPGGKGGKVKSDCDRSVRGTQGRQEGSEKEVIRADRLSIPRVQQ
jgi:Family of unknown function (DUF6496)